jgi:hypothetical protein
MPIDLMAHRLTWCGEPQPHLSRTAEQEGSEASPELKPPLDFGPFGVPLDSAALSALVDQAIGKVRQFFGIRSEAQ